MEEDETSVGKWKKKCFNREINERLNKMIRWERELWKWDANI